MKHRTNAMINQWLEGEIIRLQQREEGIPEKRPRYSTPEIELLEQSSEQYSLDGSKPSISELQYLLDTRYFKKKKCTFPFTKSCVQRNKILLAPSGAFVLNFIFFAGGCFESSYQYYSLSKRTNDCLTCTKKLKIPASSKLHRLIEIVSVLLPLAAELKVPVSHDVTRGGLVHPGNVNLTLLCALCLRFWFSLD
ncbi:hypothetical protein NQ317_006778 [Molorchus minor]|uniref:Uncharacterized protein n=1 Tax=Molorchus minor TaxID=1323400 RepID=A0ABQ9IWA1_9CUCU|nr:hypothetical protein NQ317_006778 [Molorchus minor]